MSRPETKDFAKGNTIIPSHKPLAGADDPPIDVGLPDTPGSVQNGNEKEKDTQTTPGVSPSTEKDRLF